MGQVSGLATVAGGEGASLAKLNAERFLGWEWAMEVVALRLGLGEDLRRSLFDYCIDQAIDAAYVLSAVGSLDKAMIRFADQPKGTVLEQRLEIIALNGTLSRHGLHLHIALSDGVGQLLGGHLLDGSLIYTTAEIVLGIVPGVRFERKIDLATGYLELAIIDKP